jgi:hypothetical protein
MTQPERNDVRSPAPGARTAPTTTPVAGNQDESAPQATARPRRPAITVVRAPPDNALARRPFRASRGREPGRSLVARKAKAPRRCLIRFKRAAAAWHLKPARDQSYPGQPTTGNAWAKRKQGRTPRRGRQFGAGRGYPQLRVAGALGRGFELPQNRRTGEPAAGQAPVECGASCRRNRWTANGKVLGGPAPELSQSRPELGETNLIRIGRRDCLRSDRDS